MGEIDVNSNNQTAGKCQTPDDLDQSKASRNETIQLGQNACVRAGGDHTWQDWRHIGRALEIGRAEAMHEARANAPAGRDYSVTFAAWLKRRGFEDIDHDQGEHLADKVFLSLPDRGDLNDTRAVIVECLLERLKGHVDHEAAINALLKGP